VEEGAAVVHLTTRPDDTLVKPKEVRRIVDQQKERKLQREAAKSNKKIVIIFS